MSLANFQDQLAELMWGKNANQSAANLILTDHSPALEKQLRIYREQSIENLHRQMTRIFLICQRLLSPLEFKVACAQYFLSSPPNSIDPMAFAEGFPSYLEEYTTEQDLPYLADVATLDFGCYQSKQAMEANAVSSKVFTDLAPQQLANRRVQLHPSCYWMASPYALYDVWHRFNSSLPAKAGNFLKAQEIIIIRPKFTVEVHKIDPGFIKTLDSLDAGNTLNQALMEGGQVDPKFNAVAAIQFLIQNKIIISLY